MGSHVSWSYLMFQSGPVPPLQGAVWDRIDGQVDQTPPAYCEGELRRPIVTDRTIWGAGVNFLSGTVDYDDEPDCPFQEHDTIEIQAGLLVFLRLGRVIYKLSANGRREKTKFHWGFGFGFGYFGIPIEVVNVHPTAGPPT